MRRASRLLAAGASAGVAIALLGSGAPQAAVAPQRTTPPPTGPPIRIPATAFALADASVSPRHAYVAGRPVRIGFRIDAAATLALQVEVVREATSRPVRWFALPAVAPGAAQTVQWDGLTGGGEVAPAGSYRIRVLVGVGALALAAVRAPVAGPAAAPAPAPAPALAAARAPGAGPAAAPAPEPAAAPASASAAASAAAAEPASTASGAAHLAGRLTLHGHIYPIRGPHVDRGPIGAFGVGRSGGRTHNGFDVNAACGTKLVAARGGRVVRADYDPVLYGNMIIIGGEHTRREYWYAHLLRRPRVRVGDHVTTGQRIGRIGATGNARTIGCHLHFEIRHRGVPIDPAPELHAWDAWS